MSSIPILKLGKSEYKRQKDSKNAYILLCDFLNKYDGSELTLEQIVNEWEVLGIYTSEQFNENCKVVKINKKVKSGISRLKSMIKLFGLGQIHKVNSKSEIYSISASNFTKALYTEDKKFSSFFSLNFYDFWFIQLLLKMRTEDNKIIISELLKNYIKDENDSWKITFWDFVSKDDIEIISKAIKNKDEKLINSFLYPKSGSSILNEKREQNNKNIIKETTKYITNKIDLNTYVEFLYNFLEKNALKDISEGLDTMIIGETSYRDLFKNNTKNKIIQYLKSINSDKLEILGRRLVGGSRSSYSYLNASHFNALNNIFKLHKDIFSINKRYINLINAIKNPSLELYKMESSKYYNEQELLHILNIKNEKIDNSFIQKELNEYYTNEKMISLFKELIDNNVVQGNEFNKEIFIQTIKKYVPFKEQISINFCPLYFEFLVCLSIAIKFNKNWDINYIRNSLNTILDTNMNPLSCAAGSSSKRVGHDAEIHVSDSKIIIVEPTIEMNVQVKHELESCTRHLRVFCTYEEKKYRDDNKTYEGICKKLLNKKEIETIIVAPAINEYLNYFVNLMNKDLISGKSDFFKFNTISPSTKTLDIKQLVEYLKN